MLTNLTVKTMKIFMHETKVHLRSQQEGATTRSIRPW